MADEIPQWAKERACELTHAAASGGHSGGLTSTNVTSYDAGKALARYIAEHEDPPVDPLLEAARAMLVEDHCEGRFDFFHEGVMMKDGAGRRVIEAGRFDNSPGAFRYMDALRRGMELAREQSK